MDHRLVAAAGRRLMAEHPDRLGFYEDRPYASLLEQSTLTAAMVALAAESAEPDASTSASSTVPLTSMVPTEVSGPVTVRLHTLLQRCYPSQIDDLFRSAMDRDLAAGARERVWFAAGECPSWLRRGGDG